MFKQPFKIFNVIQTQYRLFLKYIQKPGLFILNIHIGIVSCPIEKTSKQNICNPTGYTQAIWPGRRVNACRIFITGGSTVDDYSKNNENSLNTKEKITNMTDQIYTMLGILKGFHNLCNLLTIYVMSYILVL